MTVYDLKSLEKLCNSIGVCLSSYEEEDEPGEWWQVTLDSNRMVIGYTDTIAEFFAVIDALRILEEEGFIIIKQMNVTEPQPEEYFQKYDPDFVNFINAAEVEIKQSADWTLIKMMIKKDTKATWGRL